MRMLINLLKSPIPNGKENGEVIQNPYPGLDNPLSNSSKILFRCGIRRSLLLNKISTAISDFGKCQFSITTNLIFGGQMHHGHAAMTHDQKSKPEVNSRDVIKRI